MSGSVGDAVSRSGLVLTALRLLVVVGVLACLTGLSAQASTGPAAHQSVHQAVDHGSAPMTSAAPEQAPADPDHHNGAHGQECVTTAPSVDGGALLPAAVLDLSLVADASPAAIAPMAGTARAPSPPPADATVLCVWRT